MSTYAIYLNQPDPAAWETVKRHWPNRNFILDDRMAFVAPEGIVLTSEIAAAVGVSSENRRGVILEVSSYFGFNRNDLWEWLSKVRT